MTRRSPKQLVLELKSRQKNAIGRSGSPELVQTLADLLLEAVGREADEVVENTAEAARTMGFASVAIIDDELGRSGSGAIDRPGFQKLVAAVRSGSIDAVFCIEASPLARNGRDWHHLIDLCAWAGALVVDQDGTCDPRHDRLLLGLKGTMSEYEISLLRQRGLAARDSKASRGELRTFRHDLRLLQCRPPPTSFRSRQNRYRRHAPALTPQLIGPHLSQAIPRAKVVLMNASTRFRPVAQQPAGMPNLPLVSPLSKQDGVK